MGEIDKKFEKCVRLQNSDSFQVKLYVGDKNIEGLKQFDCNNNVINRYVRKNLRKQATAPGNGVMVMTDSAENDRLIGFFTLSSHSLCKGLLSPVVSSIGNTTMIPVVKLTMFGIDRSYQKKGLGIRLMNQALAKTLSVSESVGCAGLYLEAAHDAITFYQNRFNFVPLDKSDTGSKHVPMFLHLNVITGMLA
ncbi:GNAT family N-acetyltransferase [Vibrio mangrovi]|uniref:GNAT family N-acetyltransferase n=1 Tax=Vibrio mangrovi TaxID=474394 RepID=A0A1Y6J1R4_9VIBR|nr:GNAT family N-acetyltransferase [Vibrio mangrovi]MDW6002318.1 GNAT family N-acetyltransferase [Vibrio mangrovi]SMS03030.1 hypothetical protein VIM7927_04393 [Vibrio mangrovi]